MMNPTQLIEPALQEAAQDVPEVSEYVDHHWILAAARYITTASIIDFVSSSLMRLIDLFNEYHHWIILVLVAITAVVVWEASKSILRGLRQHLPRKPKR